LAPNDFWLFLKIKSALKGQRFQDTEDIKKRVKMTLKDIPQEEFQKRFQQWATCIAAQGEYFEGSPVSKLAIKSFRLH
jgi:hypothetical protein